MHNELRAEMPIVQRYAYFDHAAVAPLTDVASKRIRQFADTASQSGDVYWLDWAAGLKQLRSDAAKLIHADESEIALVPNTTQGINLVAEGFPWRPGDNIVVPDNEFPSNLVPWRNLKNRGVEIRYLRVDEQGNLSIEELRKQVNSRTRLVSVSWVGFVSGYRIDVPAFCDEVHRLGALFFLDAIQGLGAFPLNVRKTNVDFLAADGHKWLLGPEGAGLLYVKADHLNLLRPMMVGWGSLATSGFDPASLELKLSASRYEGGSTNMVGMLAFAASLSKLLEFGANQDDSPIALAILQNVAEISDKLRSRDFCVYLPASPAFRSGILTVDWPDADLQAARRFCLSRDVVLSVRANRLRISSHAYNNSEDIDRLVDALVEFRVSRS